MAMRVIYPARGSRPPDLRRPTPLDIPPSPIYRWGRAEGRRGGGRAVE
jgi:hypothetical protein